MRYNRDKPPQCSHPGACTPVLTPPAWSCSFPALSRVNQEKRTRETRKKDMIPLIGAVTACVAEKGLEILFNELRRKKTESAWAPESMLKKEYQNLSHRVETLEKDFQGGLETIKHEFKDLRAELQKNQERKEKESAWAQEFVLKKEDQNLSHRVETLEKDFQEGLEIIKNELKDVRAELKKNQGKRDEDILLALESLLKKKDQETSHRFETLEKDFQESLETVKRELKDIRAELEKSKVKKQEDIVLALESLLKKKDWETSHRFETLEKDFQESLETIKHELKDLRAELKKNQGKKERDIAWAQESMLKKEDQKLSRRVETPEKDFQDVHETIKHKLKDVRALEKNQDMEEDYKSLALVCRFRNSMWQLSQRIDTLDEDFQEGLETIKHELKDLRD